MTWRDVAEAVGFLVLGGILIVAMFKLGCWIGDAWSAAHP